MSQICILHTYESADVQLNISHTDTDALSGSKGDAVQMCVLNAQDVMPHMSGCHGVWMTDVVLWSRLRSKYTHTHKAKATLHLSIIGF